MPVLRHAMIQPRSRPQAMEGRPRQARPDSHEVIRKIASDDAGQQKYENKRKRHPEEPKKNGHIDLHDLWSK
jgi:hypothetical protein